MVGEDLDILNVLIKNKNNLKMLGILLNRYENFVKNILLKSDCDEELKSLAKVHFKIKADSDREAELPNDYTYLEEYSTHKLLAYLKDARANLHSTEEISMIKRELSKREHIPNRIERKEQIKNQKGKSKKEVALIKLARKVDRLDKKGLSADEIKAKLGISDGELKKALKFQKSC